MYLFFYSCLVRTFLTRRKDYTSVLQKVNGKIALFQLFLVIDLVLVYYIYTTEGGFLLDQLLKLLELLHVSLGSLVVVLIINQSLYKIIHEFYKMPISQNSWFFEGIFHKICCLFN